MLINKPINKINFDDLKLGETFIVEETKYNCSWIGMKCNTPDNDIPIILDLSDSIGTYYRDVYSYNVVKIIDRVGGEIG